MPTKLLSCCYHGLEDDKADNLREDRVRPEIVRSVLDMAWEAVGTDKMPHRCERHLAEA